MSQAVAAVDPRVWWNALRHGGMLLDDARLLKLASTPPKALSSYEQDRLRRRLTKYQDDPEAGRNEFVKFVLESVCGFERATGEWYRGTEISSAWAHTAITGEKVRPAQLWLGKRDAVLPVFIDSEKRIGMGRGVRVVGHALQWMRKTNNRLGLVTNGEQWRLLYAGLSYEAYAEWDVRQWFTEGEPASELVGLRTLLTPALMTPAVAGESSPFIEAINDSRKGQAELSEVLGERVRQAAELLIQGHTVALAPRIGAGEFTAQELYRAAVRMIMRLVVVLFAESREALLPRDNPIYFHSYSLGGLREQLERVHPSRLRNSYAGYPRIISLCRLVFNGSSHESLLVRAYGGQLFEPGRADSEDGVSRALAVLEHGCYEYDVMNDQQVHQILDLLSRTKIKIRQGRQSSYYAAAVDFSSLDSEYIGILYEGLLDFELRQATARDPVIFLAVGNQPALPLATLEAMDDKALKNLLEKMKDTSSDADGEGDAEADDGESAEDASGDAADSTDDAAGTIEAGADEAELIGDAATDESNDDLADDDRLTARTRAENWARRAIEAGKLVTKPRGTMTDEKRLKYDADIDRKARQIITKVILPGEWYLVRWGGTRKGSGTFYTRPQLAIPTVYRTLRPLCYDPPGPESAPAVSLPEKQVAPIEVDDFQLVAETKTQVAEPVVESVAKSSQIARDPDDQFVIEPLNKVTSAEDQSKPVHPEDAPLEDWIPKKPEEILDLKICDPACGSGTFPLSALRFLTDALYSSLHYYERIQYFADRTVIDLIVDQESKRTLAGELLPCRPEDNDFEARTKAVLRRYIVERCIYGVDLDPLAVELCRMSLWIETLDPRLPFTFLDHKIKAGNSLIGTWFDQFMHYPAMAWMREGGDKSHSNGVHFKPDKATGKKSWTQVISDRIADIKSQLIDYIDQQLYLNTGEDLHTIQTVHDDAEKALERIHRIGIHEADVRAAEYQSLRQSQAFLDAKFSLDLWCSIWFWPPEQIEHCPLVSEFYEGKLSAEATQIVERLVKQLRFFHWQLEFPDVFNSHSEGFDAILGNPPWDIAKPNSKEFFSALDPLYRSYGKQEAIAKQEEQFDSNIDVERKWLEYNAVFRAQSNWLKNSAAPYGNAISTDAKGKQSQDLNIGGGGGGSLERSIRRHDKWKENREGMTGYSRHLEELRGFRHQGGGDINLYKMFLEQAHALLRNDGRMGFIVPSGIYSDYGTGGLRSLFLDKCRWLWLFGFENREGIFNIHRSFKFNPIIIQKGGRTDTIRTAFMRRNIVDWEHADCFVMDYPRERIEKLSPRAQAFVELKSITQASFLDRVAQSSEMLISDSILRTWDTVDEYKREFDTGYTPRLELEGKGASFNPLDNSWSLRGEEYLPVYKGLMVWHYDYTYQEHVRGGGNNATWNRTDWPKLRVMPQDLIERRYFQSKVAQNTSFKIVHRRIQNVTNQRTMVAALIPPFPCSDTAARLHFFKGDPTELDLLVSLNSYVVDSIIRQRVKENHVDQHYLYELPVLSRPKTLGDAPWLRFVYSLSLCSPYFAPIWLQLTKCVDDVCSRPIASQQALTKHERARSEIVLQAIAFVRFNLRRDEVFFVLKNCDHSLSNVSNDQFCSSLDSKEFWRIDKALDPELRRTVLSAIAFCDLLDEIEKCGDREAGIRSFLNISNGDGWQLPETLRLADYGLGHDDRAKEHQPVRERFGPRFYDWQLEQDAEESWRECHLHSRNLLGPTGYQALLDQISGKNAASTAPNDEAQPSTVGDGPDDFTLTARPESKRKSRRGK